MTTLEKKYRAPTIEVLNKIVSIENDDNVLRFFYGNGKKIKGPVLPKNLINNVYVNDSRTTIEFSEDITYLGNRGVSAVFSLYDGLEFGLPASFIKIHRKR